MGLSTSLGIARSSLFTTAEQTSVISRNIANADTELYSRKTANTITVPGSGVRIVSITPCHRAGAPAQHAAANSDANAHKVIADALNQLDQTVNDPELDTSPAALISKLADALQQYQVQPQSELAGRAAITAARNLGLRTQHRDASGQRGSARRRRRHRLGRRPRELAARAVQDRQRAGRSRGSSRAPTSPTTSMRATRS